MRTRPRRGRYWPSPRAAGVTGHPHACGTRWPRDRGGPGARTRLGWNCPPAPKPGFRCPGRRNSGFAELRRRPLPQGARRADPPLSGSSPRCGWRHGSELAGP